MNLHFACQMAEEADGISLTSKTSILSSEAGKKEESASGGSEVFEKEFLNFPEQHLNQLTSYQQPPQTTNDQFNVPFVFRLNKQDKTC